MDYQAIIDKYYPAGTKCRGIFILHSRQVADKALEIIRSSRYGGNAVVIGSVREGHGVVMETALGGRRIVSVLIGEGLPRIC